MEMSVAIVTPRYAPWLGGVERHVQSIAEELAQAGLRIEVFTTDPGQGLPPVELINDVIVRRFASWAPGDAYHISPALLSGLWRRAKRFDVIHAHSYQALTCLNGALVGQRTGAFVFTPHYHGQGETRLRNLLHLPWRLPGHWLFHSAQRIICVSAAERDRLARHFPRAATRAVVIPNGVHLDAFRMTPARSPAADGRLLLAVGRLERYKNLDRLIAALPHLPPEYRAVIVGNGPYKSELHGQITRHGLAGRVTIESDCDDAALMDWYAASDLCVNLSSSEAFGITLLEAMAAGRPMLANNLPAFREVGSLSPMIRLVDLAELDDIGLAQALLAAMAWHGAAPDLSDYSWRAVAARTLAVYLDLLREERRPA